MSATIFYYTGTGNSLWVARLLAGRLGDAGVASMSGRMGGESAAGSSIVGLVFPVHIWGVPGRVVRFSEELGVMPGAYVFSVAVNGGQVSNTLVQLENILAARGVKLSAGFDVRMPSNYIPLGGPGPVERQRELFSRAERRVDEIASIVGRRSTLPVEKGPLWQRLLFTAAYRMTLSRVPAMDKRFLADTSCNSCGICERVCPAGNVTLVEGRPVWGHRCQQCFSCLQWCPQEAIQYGPRTRKYQRYRHPEIGLKDILESRSY